MKKNVKIKKTVSLLQSAAILLSALLAPLPARAVAVDYSVENAREVTALPDETAAAFAETAVFPVSVSGFDGKTADVDPRFPGAYYTFDTPLDASTLTKEALAESGCAYFDVDEAANTVILYPYADKIGAGKTVSFSAFDSAARTQNGTPLSFPAVTLAFASRAETGDNLAPYGDGHSAYPGVFADSTYTLSSGSGVIAAATDAASSYKPFLSLPLPLEEGATYKVSLKLRITAVGGKNVSAFVNPSFVYGGTNHAITGFSLGLSDEFTEKTFEHTVGTVSDRTAFSGFRMTTNPVKYRNAVVTAPSYEIKDLAAYRRLDVTYDAGEYCVLADGTDAPETTVGVYLDGSAEDTTVKITESMPYVPKDARFAVDTEKPWIDGDGNTYACGEVIDLAAVGKALVLSPHITTDAATAMLSFDHTGLAAYPENRSVFEGDTVEVASLDGFAAEEGKRFAGWALSPSGARVDSVQMDADTVLYPLFTCDYDFTFADAAVGLAARNATASRTDGTLAVKDVTDGAYVTFGNVFLPAYAISGLRFVFEGEENPMKIVYFNTGASYNADGKVKTFAKAAGKEAVREENGKTLLAVTFDTSKNEDWGGTLRFLRLDVTEDCTLLRVEFTEKPVLEGNAISLLALPTPVTGETAARSVSEKTGLTGGSSISWEPALLAGGVFDAGVAYTATVSLSPKDGYVFAPGTTVSVDGNTVSTSADENGQLVFTVPYDKTEEVASYTVTFDGSGLASATVPQAVRAFEGTALAVTPFNTAKSAVAGVRFNGWALKEGERDTLQALETLTVTEDLTLYPILNRDFNFACEESRSGWTPWNDTTVLTYSDTTMTVSQAATSWVWRYNVNLPAYLYDGVRVYYDPAAFPGSLGNIYFCRPGEGETTDRYLSTGFQTYYTDVVTGLKVVEFSAKNHVMWTDTIARFRFDFFNGAGAAGIRYIVFTQPKASEQTAFELTGLTVPQAGKPDTTAEDIAETTGSRVSFDRVEWSPSLVDGRFEAGTVYTASVYLLPRVERRFDEEAAITVTAGDLTAHGTVDPFDGTLRADFTFEKTGEYEPIELAVEGEETVYVDGKAHTYTAVFADKTADPAVKWSVDNTDVFAIDESTGALTVVKNAEAQTTVKATSLANPTVSAEMTVTSLLYPFTASIDGPTEISKEGRVTAYTLVPHGEFPIYDKSAAWSVDDAAVADIDENTGRLIPRKNGVVTVTAVSNYDSSVSASLTVTVTGQGEPFAVRFHPGTDDTVTDMPSSVVADGQYDPSVFAPSREGYVFLGWADSDESFDPVSFVTAESDLYAVWGKGTLWTFGLDGNTHESGLAEFDGYAEGVGNQYGYFRLIRQGLTIDPKTVNAVVLRSAYEKNDGTRLYYKVKFTDENGKQIERGYTSDSLYTEKMAHSVSTSGGNLDVFHNYAHNMTTDHVLDADSWWGNADTVIGVYFDLVRSMGTTFRVQYIFFGDTKRTLSFDANTQDDVTGMPEAKAVVQGDTVTVSDKPSRKGYRFIGWSKDKDSADDVRDTFGIADDLTLYAIWAKTYAVENTANGKTNTVSLGTIDTQTGDALLVGLNKALKAEVTLTYTDASGETRTVRQTTKTTGYAVFDLAGETAVENAVLSVSASYAFAEATVTSKANAEKIRDTVKTAGKEKEPRTYEDRYRGWVIGDVDMTVTTQTSDKETVEPEKTEEEPQETAQTAAGALFPDVVKGRIPFIDVKTAHWFRDEVVAAWRMGLVKGRTEELFDPDGEVTLAEAVTLAVRLNRFYHGLADDLQTDGEDWYRGYYDAATDAGIIAKGAFSDYDRPASRREVAVIMRHALPDAYLPLINRITAIPDVDKNDAAFGDILKLYNAGVLQGTDGDFAFLPDTRITRAEMAAVVNRMARPENRKRNVTERERLSRIHVYTASDIAFSAKLVNCKTEKMTLTATGAYAEADGYDPIVFLTDMLNLIDASSTTSIRVGMKWDREKIADPTESGCKLFFRPAGEPAWLIANALEGTWDGSVDENGFGEIVFTCSQNAAFAGMIDDLRFDPFARSAAFEIAYIIME